VKRLHKTWKGLARKDALLFSSLEESFTSKNNFANYRRLSHDKNENCTGAVLPYIGVVLQDLLMIEELPTTLANGMVNFRKMRRFASLLRSEILERQAGLTRFNFEPVHAIQEYLARRTPLNEQDLYRYSRLSEPSKMV
jgi:ral guanine nucleotide dissociation stimulator-like 3